MINETAFGLIIIIGFLFVLILGFYFIIYVYNICVEKCRECYNRQRRNDLEHNQI